MLSAMCALPIVCELHLSIRNCLTSAIVCELDYMS
uniref:Uncharacterized protein n=1 Tax=Arundo donax TaxID=35708 RepID=A0A0A9FE55_ARUDO